MLEPRTGISALRSAIIQSWSISLTHPVTFNKAPKITAPKETPVVKPVFKSPMKIPLLSFPVNSRTRMNEIVMIPDPPRPVIILPIKKVERSGAREVTMPPMANKNDENKTQLRGEKICASLAARGEVLDIAIWG